MQLRLTKVCILLFLISIFNELSFGLPNEKKYASLEVIVKDKKSNKLIKGAKVSFISRKRKAKETWYLHCGSQSLKSNSEGSAYFDCKDLTGSAYAEKATIGKIYSIIEIRVKVEAEGYLIGDSKTIITYENPKSKMTVDLKKIPEKSWIKDRKDEIASEGRVVKSSNPQDNVTAYPVVIVRVKNQDGIPIEGAKVTIRYKDGDRYRNKQTKSNGIVVFTPHDFKYFPQFIIQDDRAVLVGTDNPNHRKGEKHFLELKAEVNGFITSYQTTSVETFSPLSNVVFHLEASSKNKNEW